MNMGESADASARDARNETMRERIVAEALSWVRTPWHHMARVKGAGVDCAQILCAVYAAVGLVPEIDIGYYPSDWHIHQDTPRFLKMLSGFGDPIPGPPLPGDVAMFNFGRHAAHGAIVIGWPRIVHAYLEERAVVISDVSTNAVLAGKLAGFWRARSL